LYIRVLSQQRTKAPPTACLEPSLLLNLPKYAQE
jgi:hypothetical protein